MAASFLFGLDGESEERPPQPVARADGEPVRTRAIPAMCSSEAMPRLSQSLDKGLDRGFIVFLFTVGTAHAAPAGQHWATRLRGDIA
jgi:hypothetical protein